MTYPYDGSTLAALARLQTFYNGNSYDVSTNPGGMGAGGHRTNFVPSLQDVALVNDSAADAADSASTSAIAAAASATTAAAVPLALSGTSSTSVAIGTGAKSFATQTDKSFDLGSFIQVVSAADGTNFMVGQVTAYNSTIGDLALLVTYSSGSGTHSDWLLYGRAGVPGATGATGATGAAGDTPALKWLWTNNVTDTDPANGFIKFDNALYSSATQIFVDNLDSNGASQITFLDSLDNSTNTALRGTIYLEQVGTPSTYAVVNVTGVVTDGTGYRKIAITPVMNNGTFTVGQPIAFTFSRTGNVGADGAGAGDVISDIASVTDGRITIFNGTTGKHVTNATKGIGTSGANLGALDTANTWSAAQAFTSITAAGTATITSASATALTAGLNGSTNPALQVDASTALSVTGLKVKSAGIGGGLGLSLISSGTDESLTIDAKGSGTITLQGTATGAILGRTPTAGDNSTKLATTAFVAALARKKATALNLYVRTDGSDSNTGLVNNAGGAFLTIQKAVNVATYEYDSAGTAITINVADGTYAAGASISQIPFGYNQLTITGNVGTPANCVISAANGFVVQDGGIAAISGFKFTGSGTSIMGRQLGIVDFHACTFMGSGTAVMSDNASVNVNDAPAFTVDANMTTVLYAANGGKINCGGQTITMANPRTITYFALVQTGGFIDASATFSGTGAGSGMTGQQYLLTDGYLQYTNAVPGATAGQRTYASGTPTNDNAPTGGVGEYKESIILFASRQALTSGVTKDITTLSLTAGDWDVQGTVLFIADATTVITAMVGGINSTSVTMPSSGSPGRVPSGVYPNASNTMSGTHGISIPPVRFSVSGATTVYLMASATFATSTLEVFGNITARRVR